MMDLQALEARNRAPAPQPPPREVAYAIAMAHFRAALRRQVSPAQHPEKARYLTMWEGRNASR